MVATVSDCPCTKVVARFCRSGGGGGGAKLTTKFPMFPGGRKAPVRVHVTVRAVGSMTPLEKPTGCVVDDPVPALSVQSPGKVTTTVSPVAIPEVTVTALMLKVFVICPAVRAAGSGVKLTSSCCCQVMRLSAKLLMAPSVSRTAIGPSAQLLATISVASPPRNVTPAGLGEPSPGVVRSFWRKLTPGVPTYVVIRFPNRSSARQVIVVAAPTLGVVDPVTSMEKWSSGPAVNVKATTSVGANVSPVEASVMFVAPVWVDETTRKPVWPSKSGVVTPFVKLSPVVDAEPLGVMNVQVSGKFDEVAVNAPAGMPSPVPALSERVMTIGSPTAALPTVGVTVMMSCPDAACAPPRAHNTRAVARRDAVLLARPITTSAPGRPP
ncbi:MAG: hypothetical protein M9894_29505 [Planctomycetes bacterium]|nr:hypothetical protein [Planctomycetota bacterium]